MSLSNATEFLTIKECAGTLRCHPDTVSAMIRRGELKAVRLGRAIRVVSESIHHLANQTSKSSQDCAEVRR